VIGRERWCANRFWRAVITNFGIGSASGAVASQEKAYQVHCFHAALSFGGARSWQLAALECLNDGHDTAAVGTRLAQSWWRLIGILRVARAFLYFCWRHFLNRNIMLIADILEPGNRRNIVE
jgi:hypothetical protein